MIRVAIVEDHAAVAEGLRVLLAVGGIRVVGIARTAAEADELIRAERPDVILCDIMLEGRDSGFELLEQYGSQARFLMLSAYDFPAHHARAIRAGAAGYLSKMVDGETLARTIRSVAAGRDAFEPGIRTSARNALKPPTPRELELLELLSSGGSNDELAAAIGISVKTVEGMFRRLFDRYGVESRTQLVQVANRQGWLTSLDR